MKTLRLPRRHPFAAARSVRCREGAIEPLGGTEGYIEDWGILDADTEIAGIRFAAGSFVASDPDVAVTHVRLHEAHLVLGHHLPARTHVALLGHHLSGFGGPLYAPIFLGVFLVDSLRRVFAPRSVVVAVVRGEEELPIGGVTFAAGERVYLAADGSLAR